ncbi:uncharacterized protein LOC128986759 [Macrosteles quadrilineatus]|uniref:uncharacterized protein LOC128986759 n=1 Tax=Macrosteles quadrilineatus TaxID=74068 RepID=UPI0023E232FF|nr:uncharacterized protein LOC128986759 [Macrosteles quadrilineatus]
MRLSDTLKGCLLYIWITTIADSASPPSPRSKRQSNVYFRESSARSNVRFDDSEPRWSSPTDRLHSRSSVIHDPGPSWSSPAAHQYPTGSSFRFESDNHYSTGTGVEGRSNFNREPSSSFTFGKDDNLSTSYSAEQRSNLESSETPFRFKNQNEPHAQSAFKVEGRSHSQEDFSEEFHPVKSNESNESLFGKPDTASNLFRDSSSVRVSDEVTGWKSSEESSFPGSFRQSKHFRQSKVSPLWEVDSSVGFPGVEDSGSVESGRHLSPDTLATISETLGAINTVGRYLVNYTRGSPPGDRLDSPPPPRTGEDLPGAIITISKNVLGRNVTERLTEPLVRVLPIGGTENSPAGVRTCTTPGGSTGYCEDLSNCPQLLLDLGNLRQSICFKSLFVPGVCCPKRGGGSDTTFLQEVTTSTRRPLILTTAVPLVTSPSQTIYTTTISSVNSIDFDAGTGECGVQEAPKFRVVGGEEALPGRWPWMAAIFLHGPRRTEFWCGGSLIGSKYILTAAHCTKDTRQRPFQARQFTVRLGDIDLKRNDEPSGPQTYRVAEVRAHPRFSRVGFYNDIAVLVLEKSARRSRYVIPVCLPPPQYRHSNFVGDQPTVVGWGTTYYGGKESTVQRQVALPVWKNEDCDRTYFQPINENFICAGLKEGGKDACQGDSGGPLVLKKNGRWMQIGIVSFGNKCGEPGYPGVYTRITQYLDWISSNTVS